MVVKVAGSGAGADAIDALSRSSSFASCRLCGTASGEVASAVRTSWRSDDKRRVIEARVRSRAKKSSKSVVGWPVSGDCSVSGRPASTSISSQNA